MMNLVLAWLDKLGIKVIKGFDYDEHDTVWVEQGLNDLERRGIIEWLDEETVRTKQMDLFQ